MLTDYCRTHKVPLSFGLGKPAFVTCVDLCSVQPVGSQNNSSSALQTSAFQYTAAW
jgi:hypothetical protein